MSRRRCARPARHARETPSEALIRDLQGVMARSREEEIATMLAETSPLHSGPTRALRVEAAGGRFFYRVALSDFDGSDFKPRFCFSCQERPWDRQCVWCGELHCRGCSGDHICLEEMYSKAQEASAEYEGDELYVDVEDWWLRTNQDWLFEHGQGVLAAGYVGRDCECGGRLEPTGHVHYDIAGPAIADLRCGNCGRESMQSWNWTAWATIGECRPAA